MNKTKCPHCGTVQDKQGVKQDIQMKMLEAFFNSINATIVANIECVGCQEIFEQDKYEVEDD